MFQFFLLWGINLLATQFNRQEQKRRTTRKFKAPIHMALKMRPTGLRSRGVAGRGQGRVRGKLETVEGVGEDGRGGMKEAARACPERPARRQGTSDFVPRLGWRYLDQAGGPSSRTHPPAVADQPKTPETVALEMA